MQRHGSKDEIAARLEAEAPPLEHLASLELWVNATLDDGDHAAAKPSKPTPEPMGRGWTKL